MWFQLDQNSMCFDSGGLEGVWEAGAKKVKGHQLDAVGHPKWHPTTFLTTWRGTLENNKSVLFWERFIVSWTHHRNSATVN